MRREHLARGACACLAPTPQGGLLRLGNLHSVWEARPCKRGATDPPPAGRAVPTKGPGPLLCPGLTAAAWEGAQATLPGNVASLRAAWARSHRHSLLLGWAAQLLPRRCRPCSGLRCKRVFGWTPLCFNLDRLLLVC